MKQMDEARLKVIANSLRERRSRVAVVDDDEAVREVCKVALRRHSYEVVDFPDAKSILSALQQEKFDIAIIDLVLPDSDGFSLFKTLREAMPHLIGIAITGQSSSDMIVQSLSSGMLWVLIKPFTILELLSVVDAACKYALLLKEADQASLHVKMANLMQSLLREIELESLAEQLIRAAVEHTTSDAASLLVVDRLHGCLRVAAATGTLSVVKGMEIKPTSGIVGLVIQSGKPVLINRESIKQAQIAKRLRYGGRGSAISLPLISEDNADGVLNITRWADEPQFTESDLEGLVWFSAQASVALCRSLRYEWLKESLFGTAQLLISFYEAQDPYRHSHSERVSELACALAAALGCSKREIELLRVAGALYQLGLYQISKEILHKPSKLTEEEYNQIKRYPELSLQLLKDLPLIWDVGEIILAHREHYDGSGYPMGKAGDEIPLPARVLAIADTYVALTSPRSYRPAMDEKQAVDELRKMAGRELDPKITEVFINTVLPI